jgi:hypothetical protein
MSALFKFRPKRETSEDYAKTIDRRSSSTFMRLRAGLYLRYQAATGAQEFDTFQRDAKTWAAFEHAVLPELSKFTFIDASRQTAVSEIAVLADAMYHIWTVTTLGLDIDNRPTTINIISDLAKYICATYDTKPIDRRAAKRNWFGLNAS